MNKKLLLTLSVSFLALGAGKLNCNAQSKNNINTMSSKKSIKAFKDSYDNTIYVNEDGTVVKSDIKDTNT
ncbi:hypothetical protein, partial [Apilactobacillus xinyiensis]|uniref:hypothetical protein n=1 Tax=Apilactobacillus xinyiensis TaxID=2841032 RepID=UPI001C7CA24E